MAVLGDYSEAISGSLCGSAESLSHELSLLWVPHVSVKAFKRVRGEPIHFQREHDFSGMAHTIAIITSPS